MKFKLTEKTKTELAVGDVVITKQGKKEYTIKKISAGVNGKLFPYLTLEANGEEIEHDTSFDSYTATYTVKEVK